jgi:hypothetical protein
MTLDPLSKAARDLLRVNADVAYTKLLPREHGPAAVADRLHAMSPADVIAGKISDADDAACVLAALWLWHDYLDESHTICQAIDTPSGSYLHAMMHRREGDFGNAKYWVARAGRHPAFDALANQAADLVAAAPANKALLRMVNNGWNGAAFVDFVQQVHESPSDPLFELAVALQQMEWRVIFDHCLRGAVG